MDPSAKRRAIYANFAAVAPHLVAEIVGGDMLTRPVGPPQVAIARTALGSLLERAARRADRLILSQIELHIGDDVLVPHLGRWERSVVVQHADAAWLDVLPDWVLDIGTFDERAVSRAKWRIYANAGIGHVWSLDPSKRVLETFELRHGEWWRTHRFGPSDVVSADPFVETRFELNNLWPQLGGSSVTNTH